MHYTVTTTKGDVSIVETFPLLTQAIDSITNIIEMSLHDYYLKTHGVDKTEFRLKGQLFKYLNKGSSAIFRIETGGSIIIRKGVANGTG